MSKLLQVNDLTTAFTGDFGKKISVDHVSFEVAEGETVCIVGESGGRRKWEGSLRARL